MDAKSKNPLTKEGRIYTLYIFEWDGIKAEINLKKHQVSFDEAQTVFYDEYALMIHDVDHSDVEDRFIMLGMSARANLLVVCYCERGEEDNVIRIISSRRANKRESAQYWARRK